MARIERKMLFVMVVLIICGVSKAEVYKVGEASGWTSSGDVDYKSWAASKEFHVGDTIVFDYKKELHNVVRVTHINFNKCNATAPYATWTTGNDSFTIKHTGHYYFICSLPGHCEGGQRVDIRVPGPTTPKVSPPQLPTPLAPAPAPAPSSATYSWTKSSFLVAAIVSIFWF